MQCVSVGDLYFLRSPFHSTVSAQHEKKIAYMLGTVSSRPAVVVRAPQWWDNYSTVTVIPALSNGTPAITFRLQDRYGYLTEADYPFMPHTPHSIPVGRLGRYIGRLSKEELDELMYAFHWIHSPEMQENTVDYEIPKCYKEVIEAKIPSTNKFITKEVDFSVDENMKLHSHSDATKDLDGVTLNINLQSSISPSALRALETDPDYKPLSLPSTESSSTAKVVKVDDNAVPVERDFPMSIFTTEELHRVAGRFDIDSRYYEGDNQFQKRNPDVLTQHEINNMRGEMTLFQFNGILEFYKKLYPFDAFLLGPRLPTIVLKNLLENRVHYTTQQVIVLKKVCTYLQALDETVYQNRLKKLMEGPVKETKTEPEVDPKIQEEKYRGYIEDLKKYLTPSNIHKIPPRLQKEFLELPSYMVKRAYTGKAFHSNYTKAYDYYKNHQPK